MGFQEPLASTTKRNNRGRSLLRRIFGVNRVAETESEKNKALVGLSASRHWVAVSHSELILLIHGIDTQSRVSVRNGGSHSAVKISLGMVHTTSASPRNYFAGPRRFSSIAIFFKVRRKLLTVVLNFTVPDSIRCVCW